MIHNINISMIIKKSTFLKKLRYRRKHWDSTIDTIIANNLENEKISQKWYLKDIIAHITWYEKELLFALEHKSIVESEFWNMKVDERNNVIFTKTQENTLSDILTDSTKVFNNLIAKVEDLTHEDLNSENFVERKEGTRITHDFIGGISFWHYEDHEDALIDRFDLEYGCK